MEFFFEDIVDGLVVKCFVNYYEICVFIYYNIGGFYIVFFDKGNFFNCVIFDWKGFSVEGNMVGEIVFIKEDCVRIVSVVVDEDMDFMVVDRMFYNWFVCDVFEKEFYDKI